MGQVFFMWSLVCQDLGSILQKSILVTTTQLLGKCISGENFTTIFLKKEYIDIKILKWHIFMKTITTMKFIL